MPHGLVAVGQDARPYPSTAMWAEPDLDAAARLMRDVYVSEREVERWVTADASRFARPTPANEPQRSCTHA